MALNIVECAKNLRDIIGELPQPLSESMALLMGLMYRCGLYAVINAYTDVYKYQPLKINESVLG
jgi:hypothetical protein